jgi:thiol:disulfide interchange protein DsbC
LRYFVLRAVITAFLLFPLLALADEAQIRRVMEAKLGGAKIEGIQPAPMPGLYEVRFRGPSGVQVVYTDANASYIVSGKIYDARTDRDLTEERLRKLNAIRFDSLPFEQAVKVQRGSGTRVLAMFSDPYCPACKQFEQTLQQLDDITIYVFMYPVIRPELSEQSKAVWCSPDRSKAWLDLALRGNRPSANSACEGPVDKNLALGRGLGVNSTPTLIFVNGERVAGGLAAADLQQQLDSAKR